MRFNGIDCNYEIVDFKKYTHTEVIYDEDGECFECKNIDKIVLLEPDSDAYKTIAVTKNYMDEMPYETAYEIVEDVVNRVMKWDVICENITRYPILLYAVEGTTTDFDVIEVDGINSIDELDKIYSGVTEELIYKFRKIYKDGRIEKLI